jgi:TrmH RNA methyltransferase
MKPDAICGANAVAALFTRRPGDVLRLFYLAEMRRLVGAWCALLAETHRPYRMVEAAELEKVAGTPHHGGVVAVAKPLLPAMLDLAAPPRVKLLLVLDGIGNPHNLGAIARSAAFFGLSALLIGEGPAHAMPSAAALRTAEGGLEWLALYRTRDLAGAMLALDRHYCTVAATLGAAAEPLAALPRDRPLALVLGNEERGVSPLVLAACRRQVCIGGSGRVQSLNVAQSAAVLLHALAGGT